MGVGRRWQANWQLVEVQVFSTFATVGWINNRYGSNIFVVSAASSHIVQQVSALEQVSYYQLSMEEGEVNDNTIKLTRAVNLDLTPAV